MWEKFWAYMEFLVFLSGVVEKEIIIKKVRGNKVKTYKHI